MTAISTSLSVGRGVVGRHDAVIVGRTFKPRRPVIYLGGAGSDASEAVGGLTPAVAPLLKFIARSNDYIVLSPTVTQTWGNEVTTTNVDALLAWARANAGATDEAPFLIGASHGAACALTYALPSAVAGVVAIIPAVDVESLRAGDVMGLQSEIDEAWGVTYPTPLPASANPVDNNPLCPVQIWYATDDAISVNVVDYADDIEADLRSVGALGHTNAAIAAVDETEVLEFIESSDWRTVTT